MKKTLLLAALLFAGTILNAQPIEGWMQRGKNYKAGLDKVVYKTGGSSASLECIKSKVPEDDFGTLLQSCGAEDFIGQRVKMSAWIKADNVADWAGMWLRIDGKDPEKGNLGFDNMQNRPVKGTADWRLCEIVLDVPTGSRNFSYGILLSGTGKIWFDEVSFEIVDKSVPTTDMNSPKYAPAPVNLDFSEAGKNPEIRPIKGWFMAGSAPKAYKAELDKTVFKSAPGSAFVESVKSPIDGFGTLMQTCSAQDYLGKRVRMGGWIKSENVMGEAGMWLRIDGKDSGAGDLGFDNMSNRPIKGTADWARFDIVLNVPQEAVTLNFGILIGGTGKVWFDDVSFEVVDMSVPTTNMNVNRSNPVNLDFSS